MPAFSCSILPVLMPVFVQSEIRQSPAGFHLLHGIQNRDYVSRMYYPADREFLPVHPGFRCSEPDSIQVPVQRDCFPGFLWNREERMHWIRADTAEHSAAFR